MHWLDHYVVQNTLIMDRDHVRCQVWGSRSVAADTVPLLPGPLLLIMNFTRVTPVAMPRSKATSTPATAKYLLLPNSSVVERDRWRAC
jgi:hypothetical protein